MSGRVIDEVGGREIEGTRSPSLHHLAENLPYVHRVGVSPKQKLLKEFTSTLKETFFHDEPLRPFKDQPKLRKLVLGLQALFPILEWGRDYNLSKFKGDLIAGLTIASLAIPQVKKFFTKFVSLLPYHFPMIQTQPLDNFLQFINFVKQDIGYAKLANLDPQYGLCKFLHVSYEKLILPLS